MRTPAAEMEPAIRDPRKLRRTALLLVALMCISGPAIYYSYLKAEERSAADDRPSIVSRLSEKRDMALVRQDGSVAAMSELYGHVWLVCGISAKQPETWAATREVLKRMSEKYAGRNDFHILCLTVDPQNEGPEVLGPVAASAGATLPQWWFGNADVDKANAPEVDTEAVQKFLKNNLKLSDVPHLKDGKWVYDPSITVIDRDLHLRKGTIRASKRHRKSYPFDFEEAARLDREGRGDNTRKLEELLVHVIDFTLAQTAETK